MLFEIPNRGKTVLLTFKSAVVKPKQDEVATVEQQAAIGQAVFDHLVNTLGVLTQDLQPDVILLLPPEPERAAQFRAIASGGAGSLDPFLSGTTELDMGLGIKIPLSLVLTPIVKPVRWLLGVRVIDGSVLADPQGYTVLVRASSGEVWQARLRDEDRSRERPAGGSTDPPIVRLTPASAFTQLALELAFRIMSAEPTLASVGMTRSWEAFTDFRQGLLSWQRYAVQSGEQDPDALTEAIRRFRAAIGVDPTFALAHYRLGLALHKDGQPVAAAEALRTSLKANPGFVPARVALASVLYGLDSRTARRRRSRRPSVRSAASGRRAMLPPPPSHDELHEAMIEEARSLWQSVVDVDVNASPLDRAAAWAGLCRHALERGAVEDTVRPARDSAAERWPAGSGRPGRGRACSTRRTSIASRQTAPTRAFSPRVPKTSGSGRRARRSWPRWVSCSNSTGRAVPAATSTAGSARRPRWTRVPDPRGRAGTHRSREPLHATCAAVLPARPRAPAGRSRAPMPGSDGGTGARWLPARGRAAHAGPGERRDGSPDPGRLLP